MNIQADGLDTAVVVLSFNGKDYHRSFFPLLVEESQGKYDIILIDNASTDDTLSYVQEHFPSVKTIHLDTNEGFTGGYVSGLRYLQGYKYWVLLSADFEVTRNWFEPLHLNMENNAQIAACQPKIKYYKDKNFFEYAGAAGGFVDSMGYFFCRGRLFDTLEKDEGQYDQKVECFWAGGGCFMVQTEVYKNLGGLEKDLYAHMEEIDLCWRMKNAGFQISCFPDSTVYHVGGSVISYGSPQKTFYNFRNNLLIYVKNYHGFRFWFWLIGRLILDGIAALKFLISADFKNFLAVFRAHLSFYWHLPRFWSKRKVNKLLLAPNPDMKGIFPKLLIWEYYIKKKTKFSELEF